MCSKNCTCRKPNALNLRNQESCQPLPQMKFSLSVSQPNPSSGPPAVYENLGTVNYRLSAVALISTMGKTLRGIQRELSEARTWYAQYSTKYVNLKLFQELPYIKMLELTSSSRSYFSSVVKRRIEGGTLICKYSNQPRGTRVALIKLIS